MDFLWLGNREEGEGDADAHYEDGYVWSGREPMLGSSGTGDAVARYEDGYIWLGDSVDGTGDAVARYEDGCIWLGSRNRSRYGEYGEAVARYEDGCVWLGSRVHGYGDSDARYSGDDDGAAAAAFVLLLSDAAGAGDDGAASDDSDNSEVSDGDSSDDEPETEDTDTRSGDDSGGDYSEGYSASYSSTSSSSSSLASHNASQGDDGGGFFAFLIVVGLVIVVAIVAERSKASRSVSDEPSPLSTAPAPSAPQLDPWNSATSLPASFSEGKDLRVSEDGELTVDGTLLRFTLTYADREKPQNVFIGERSATGRYRLLTICGTDWCDDVRIIDLRRHLIATFCCSKSGAESASWSPDDRYVVIERSHAGDSDLICLNTATLQTTSIPSESPAVIFGNESGDIDPPDGFPKNAPHLNFALESSTWISARELEVDAAITKIRWSGEPDHAVGEPVESGSVVLKVSVPDLSVLLLHRSPVESGTSPLESSRSLSASGPADGVGASPAQTAEAQGRASPTADNESSGANAQSLPRAVADRMENAQRLISSGLDDAYLRAAQEIRTALDQIASVEALNGRSDLSNALREKAMAKHSELLVRCRAENDVNRRHGTPAVPCPTQ